MKRVFYFSSGERYVIAEYIYNYAKDSLTKEMAAKLVYVLCRHKILFNLKRWMADIVSENEKVATKIINILSEAIDKVQVKEIMFEYYELSI